MKIGAVVLNYKTYKDTIECVYSILEQTYKDFVVIIVDNGSGNESSNILSSKFKSEHKVVMIESERNLGFARGNNLGINFAKKELNCDYIFVVNNDTLVDKNVFEQVINESTDGIGVISPTVRHINGDFQPLSINTNNLTKSIIKTYIGIFILYFFHLPGISGLYKKYKILKRNVIKKSEKKHNQIQAMNYALQGPAYFLTPNFFRYYNQLFPKTFLYWEEINLLWYLKKVRLKTKVISTSPVIHKEAQSTFALVGNHDLSKRKMKFITQSMISSTPLFFMSYKMIKKYYN